MPTPTGMGEGHAETDALFREFAPRVRRLATRMLRNAADAEEVVQDVFLRAWLQRERFDDRKGTREAWLLAMARNRSIDYLRARRTRASELTRPAFDGELFESQPIELDYSIVRAILRCIQALPAAQRIAIELAFIEGYTHTEIAHLLRQPLGTVKTRIRLALLEVREVLHSGVRLPEPSGTERPLAATLAEFLRRSPARPRRFESLLGTRVLVVDDDRDTCDLVAIVLESAGAIVDRARSSSAAEVQLGAIWPDVMIADIGMPEMDGYVLMSRVRAFASSSNRSLRAVAFTARARPEDRSKSVKAGFDAHLAKPADPQTIVHTVATLVSPS